MWWSPLGVTCGVGGDVGVLHGERVAGGGGLGEGGGGRVVGCWVTCYRRQARGLLNYPYWNHTFTVPWSLSIVIVGKPRALVGEEEGMAKRNHHFVPRFYLTAFQSDVRRIHLFNVSSARPIMHASLRDQCYRHKLYGKSDQVEDFLMDLENKMAPVLKTVVSSDLLPPVGSLAHDRLMTFAAMQMMRTPKQASLLNRLVDKGVKQAYSRSASDYGVDIEHLRFGWKDPVLVMLDMLPTVSRCFADLSAHLVVAAGAAFITSDNPVFKYNQYCETVQHEGVTGALQKGLQVFVPLSPRHQLVLYDGSTYRVSVGRSSRSSRAKQSDIDQFNKIQIVAAEENVYFSDWQQMEDVDRLEQRTKQFRIEDPMVAVEFGADEDPSSSLIHEFERMENISLNLTFLRVKEGAAKIPVADRAEYTREGNRPKGQISNGGAVKTFSRFIGRR